jgi:hypothetical protein
MKNLIDRLNKLADDNLDLARSISNTGHPETDNNYGREATTCKQAADILNRLLQCGFISSPTQYQDNFNSK